MPTPIGSILRKATRKPNDKLNILCAPVHERVQSMVSLTGHNFYAYQRQEFKSWNSTYAPPPDNFTLMPFNTILPEIEFDLAVGENVVGGCQILFQVAQQLGIPTLRYEHTMAYPEWDQNYVRQMKNVRGDVNVFITDFSRKTWLFEPHESVILSHGVNDKLFRPLNLPRRNTILTVANEFPSRDRPLGFSLYKELTQGLPTHPVGHSPGFSEAAKSLEDLVREYNTCDIFLNTSILSPIPCAVLEAAACEALIISTATCAIPEFLVHNESALLSNNPKELRYYLEDALANPSKYDTIRQNARKAVLEKCPLDKFVKECNVIFKQAARIEK